MSVSALVPARPAYDARSATTTGTLVVEGIEEVAEGVRSLELASADGTPLPPWTPGAHVDLVLPSGRRRQYSLCGDPGDASSWRLAVLLPADSRGGSREVHSLVCGSRVGFEGPRNNFVVVPAERYLFVAGGIGITPILPMVHEAARRGLDWQLVYGGRSLASMAFAEHLRDLDPARVELVPQDVSGLPDLDRFLAPRPQTLVYCCGPAPLLRAVEERMGDTWAPGSLHLERFRPADEVAVPGAAFEVVLARTGTSCFVDSRQSILEVVRDVSPDVLSSCEEGTCGTCLTDVLEGEPDHRDVVLTSEERERGDCMLICVSRSRTPRLVLDL